MTSQPQINADEEEELRPTRLKALLSPFKSRQIPNPSDALFESPLPRPGRRFSDDQSVQLNTTLPDWPDNIA